MTESTEKVLDQCSYPGFPPEWRDAVTPNHARFACALVAYTMLPYWHRRHMRFSHEMFMSQWYDFDALLRFDNGKPTGVIAWSVLDEEHCHLRELHLDDGLRGQGKGCEVLNAWVDYCRSLQIKRLTLKVFAENPARRLYERMGFETFAEEEHVANLLKMQRYL